jgi:uncharacterized protein YwqG
MEQQQRVFPAKLEPWRARLEATEQAFVGIIPVSGEEPALWSSKLGGRPYLPKGEEYPCGEDGAPLFFLAQLNFGEMPALAGYPDKGLVQFFIGDDGVYGMGEEDLRDQANYRVRYFAEVAADVAVLETDFSFLPAFEDVPLSAGLSVGMRFEVGKGLMPELDYRFDEQFGEDFFGRFGSEEWSLAEAYGKLSDAGGHRVGGYSEFTQEDPREPGEEMLSLFQLDTDRRFGISWGDMGLGHFFISAEDLARRDFSRVLYYWDCF